GCSWRALYSLTWRKNRHTNQITTPRLFYPFYPSFIRFYLQDAFFLKSIFTFNLFIIFHALTMPLREQICHSLPADCTVAISAICPKEKCYRSIAYSQNLHACNH